MAPTDWRAATTAAFQDYVAFEMKPGEGVGIGDLPRMSDLDRVGVAVAGADATELVESLPDGLDTVVGRYIGGRALSGGQWQRLALARGLMGQAPLLVVLDEPTASLDAPTEAALFSRYREAARRMADINGAITVLVSHRFSTVHMADLIVVLDGGRVTEAGSHATLMAGGGLYADLFRLQAQAYLGSL
jgi:ATP-binding cassette subfamily B protein